MKRESHMQINERLNQYYTCAWQDLNDIRAHSPKLSTPHFVSAFPDYDIADRRIVFVAQETKGWLCDSELDGMDAPACVTRLMNHYTQFNLGTDHAYRATYWNPVHDLYRLILPNGPACGFVSINALIMDEDVFCSRRKWKNGRKLINLREPFSLAAFKADCRHS